jgi:hypothetical protein
VITRLARAHLHYTAAPHLTFRLRASSNRGMDVPQEIRELPDVTIVVRETAPGFFEASFKPTDPLHISRNGYTLDTKRGLRGRTLTEVLDRAEANWRQNYPVS